jgi:esterase/lipase superfamily enzyme
MLLLFASVSILAAQSETSPNLQLSGSVAPKKFKGKTASLTNLLEKSSLIVPIYYATSRKSIDSADGSLAYGTERGVATAYGKCFLSVPSHAEMPPVTKRLAADLSWKIYRPKTEKKFFDFQNIFEGFFFWDAESRKPERKYTTLETSPMKETSFFEELKSKLKLMDSKSQTGVVVYVHGYANDFNSSCQTGGAIARYFELPVVVYSWPSLGKSDAYSYLVDESTSEWCEADFERFVSNLGKEVGFKNIIIIAHSMGNRLISRMLQQLSVSQDLAKDDDKFREIDFVSPEIDKMTFDSYEPQAIDHCSVIRLFVSGHDRALDLSSWIHGSYSRAGSVFCDRESAFAPKGKDVQVINFTVLDTELFGHKFSPSLLASFYKTDNAPEHYDTEDVSTQFCTYRRLIKTKRYEDK